MYLYQFVADYEVIVKKDNNWLLCLFLYIVLFCVLTISS
jgi:hypothetical protein